MLFVALANLSMASSPVVLSLRAGDEPKHAGEPIVLKLSIRNTAERPVQIDNGALISYLVFADAAGNPIPQWPFMDILAEEPGKEAYWTLAAGDSQTVDVRLTFKRDSWSGFGVPDGSYEGLALEVSYAAGSAIHAVPKLPSVVRVEQRWLADAGTVRRRAKRLGVAPRAVWSGEIASNPVWIKLTEPGASVPGPETFTGRTYPEILAQVAADIARKKPDYPQLRDFEPGDVSGDTLFYAYRAAPDPKIEAGWRRGFPQPQRGGVVIWIRLLRADAVPQDVFAPASLGAMDAPVYVLDGAGTKPLAGVIDEIMKEHGWRPGPRE